MRRFVSGLALCLALTGSAFAQTFTVATFSDPATDGSTPLFELNGLIFDGGWSGTGLDLLTPGLAAPDFIDATFDMDALTLTDPNTGELSGGQIRFYDSSNVLQLTIDFSGAQLYVPFVFGASDGFMAETVTFGGPAVTTPLTAESFAFSFANQEATRTGFTATSAFTSSAVPEPSSIALVLMGSVLGWFRRR